MDEDDELPVLTDELDAEDEVLGLEDAEDLVLAEIDEGPEEIGLDVETLEGEEGLGDELDDDDDDVLGLDDKPLDLDDELDESGDEDGWTEDSEGASEPWDDDDAADEEEEGHVDDGGLEGVEEPIEDLLDETETTIPIDGSEDDESEDEELGRVELDLG